MLATVSIVVLLFVIVVVFAVRMNRVNSMERSIRSYKRRLGTIAEVVEQTSQIRTSQVHAVPVEPESKIVLTDNLDADQHVHDPDTRVHPELGDRVYVGNEGRLVFGDMAITPVVPPKPPIYDDRTHRRMAINHANHASSRRRRRLSLPLTAAVSIIIVGGVLGGLYVAKPNANSSALETTTTLAVHHQKVVVHHPTTPVHHQTVVTTGRLLSSSSTTAVFKAPQGNYTVSVYVDGLCWIGFQHSGSKAGSWLAMATLGGGADPKSYQFSGSGSLAITVGAPTKMTKLVVNGTSLGLPTQRGPSSYVITLKST